jgi:hypothetical protein
MAQKHLHIGGIVQNLGEDDYVERTTREHGGLSGPGAQIEMWELLFAPSDLLQRTVEARFACCMKPIQQLTYPGARFRSRWHPGE